MMLDKKEATRVTQIDEHHLDRECIRLPSEYLHFAFLAAEAKRTTMETKAKLEVVQAEVAKKVRNQPGDFGIDKVTEAAISGAVITSEEYRDAQKDYFDSQHDYDVSQAVVWAMEHKKKALSLLIDLQTMSYSPEVKVSKEGKEVVEEMIKRRTRRRHQDGDDTD